MRNAARLLPALALAACLATAPGAASAAASAAWSWTPSATYLHMGDANGVRAFNSGLIWPWGWSHDSPAGQLSGYWDVTLGAWRSSTCGPAYNGSKWFAHMGITPVLRLQPPSWSRHGIFAEAGIGLNAIAPRFRNGKRHFSSQFNFGSHLGAGLQFGQHRQHEITLRYQHFSNGSYRSPNPGQNFLQVRYTHQWR